MLWQRTNAKDKTIWVALGDDGKRIKDESGKYTVRYEAVGGCAYYTTSRATLDKEATPEELPDGWPADSPQGIISRFCFTAEARSDWAFLDAWKRRKNTSVTHMGCGEGQWPEVPLRVPLTCPRCGVLAGDDTVYAQWYTVKDPEGESVKACVLEAWITGKRNDYLAGRRMLPPKSQTKQSPAPVANREPEVVPEMAGHEAPKGKSSAPMVITVLAVMGLGAVAFLYLTG